jgi:DNA-directed RNA polymerase specialized sigma24 family protein
VATQAPDETLVRVAQVLGITSAELREAGRSEAADLFDELAGPPSPASAPGTAAGNPQVDAIAALLATLPPEAQDEVLRRVGLAAPQPAQGEKEAPSSRRRRAS